MPNPFRAVMRRGTRASVFGGAATGRLYEDWNTWTLSPDYEVRANLRLLRARARDLAKNNPWIAGFADEVANNVVGEKGIRLHAQVRKTLGKRELATSTNFELERGWEEWGNPENASADACDSWIDLQRLIIQTVAIDGECFVRRLRGAENAFGYTLQLIDADLIDETFNRGAGPGQNEIRMGIEVDRRNRRIAYHVWTRYPSDMTGTPLERERIVADDMIHLFIRYRPNQTRGVSWLAPILTKTKHLDGYEMNELVSSRAAAGKQGFIINKSEPALAAYTAPKAGAKPKRMAVTPGSIDELPPGAEFQSFDPMHPTTAYEMFTSNVLRAIARGLKVSYLSLTGDLRQANYSSMRAGETPARERWRALQGWFACHLNRLVYRDWVDMATLKGAIAVDGRLGSNYYDVEWRGRGWKWVDPKNDLESAKLEIDLGLNSRQRLAAEQGRDFEEIVDDLEYEESYAEAAGVDVSGNQVSGVNPVSVSPAGKQEDASGSGDGSNDAPADSTTAGHDDELRLVAVR